MKYEAEAEEEVVSNFREADEGEAHAEAEETAGAGNVRDPAHLLRLPEPFCVRFLKQKCSLEKAAVGNVIKRFSTVFECGTYE